MLHILEGKFVHPDGAATPWAAFLQVQHRELHRGSHEAIEIGMQAKAIALRDSLSDLESHGGFG